MNLPQNVRVMQQANNYVSQATVKELRVRPFFEDAIVFAKVGAAISHERKRIAHSPFLIDNNMMAFTPKQKEDLEFIYHLFQRIKLSKYSQIGALPSYNASDILDIRTFYPTSKSERNKIVTILNLVSNRIEKQAEMITNLKKYKRGLHKLVFIKNRKPSWEKSALHDIASFCGGGTPSKDVSSYWDGEIGWISSSDIQEEWIDDISVTRRITKKAIDNSATKLCPEGTIAIVSRVGVGKVAIIPESLCTSQDFTNITSITGNTHYMAYQIAFRMKLEAMKTQGTSIKGVTADTIKSMVLDIPPLEEQKKIADMLTAFDSYIKRAVYELNLFLTMKKALLQQLFI